MGCRPLDGSSLQGSVSDRNKGSGREDGGPMGVYGVWMLSWGLLCTLLIGSEYDEAIGEKGRFCFWRDMACSGGRENTRDGDERGLVLCRGGKGGEETNHE